MGEGLLGQTGLRGGRDGRTFIFARLPARRPARNIAEVALTIGTTAARMPRCLQNGFAERDRGPSGGSRRGGGLDLFGSTGREGCRGRARCRLMFADAASGAQLPGAIGVSQGENRRRLIAAKPRPNGRAAPRKNKRRAQPDSNAAPSRDRRSKLQTRGRRQTSTRLDDVIATMRPNFEATWKKAGRVSGRRLSAVLPRQSARNRSAAGSRRPWLAGRKIEAERTAGELRGHRTRRRRGRIPETRPFARGGRLAEKNAEGGTSGRRRARRLRAQRRWQTAEPMAS